MKTNIYGASAVSLKGALEKIKGEMTPEWMGADFFIFAINPDYEMETVNETIRNVFGTDRFLAFCAIDSFENSKIAQKGVTLCCIKFEREGKLTSFYIENIDAHDALEETAGYLNTHQDRFHVVLAGLCGGNIASFIEKLSCLLTYEPIENIVGGVASGNLEAEEVHTFLFIDGKIIKNGFVLISFENVRYAMDVALGFKPYGITYEVRKADGVKLYTVDEGKSASYMASKMLEHVGVEDVRYLWYVPFSMLSAKNGYVKSLRTIASIHETYVELFAPVKNGDFFKLSFATPEDLIEEDKRTARRAVQKLPNPEIVFDFSCVARQYVLEEKQAEELRSFIDIFRSNLFGLFTFGEIGPDKMYKKLTFYNETSLIALLREK